jgi:hypothetical protein
MVQVQQEIHQVKVEEIIRQEDKQRNKFLFW